MDTTSVWRFRWQVRVHSVRLWLILAGCIIAWAVVLPAEVERIAQRSQLPVEVLSTTYSGLTTWSVLLLATPILVLVQLFLVTTLGYFWSLFFWSDTSFSYLWDGMATASLVVLGEAVLHAVWFKVTGRVEFQMHLGWLFPWGRAINPFEMLLIFWMFTAAATKVKATVNRQTWLTACLTWCAWAIIKYQIIGGA